MLSTCSSCPGFLVDQAARCPHCGAEQKPPAGLLSKAIKLASGGLMMVTLMACYGGGYDDFYTECTADIDCFSGTCDSGYCTPFETCGNGADDDFDGLTDLGDPDCQDTTEVSCLDGVDNDDDGRFDCADLDCAAQPECSENCGDAIDNDLDGEVDCADSDCPPCAAIEVDCGNELDDDQDGMIDCADPDCTGTCSAIVCGDGILAMTEQCDDGNEELGDGCEACLVVFPTFCDTIPQLILGEQNGVTGDGSNVLLPSCSGPGTPEDFFAFTSPGEGVLYLTVDSAVDVAVVVTTACNETIQELGCVNEVAAGITESGQIVLTTGEEVLIAVDSPSSAPATPYTLSASFVQ